MPFVSIATSEPLFVQGGNQRLIQLQERFAARADHIAGVFPRRPAGGHGLRQSGCRAELSSPGTIRTHKIGVAELAYGGGPIRFPSTPEIASGEAQKDCRAPCAGALSLNRVLYFLDAVRHVLGSVSTIWRRRMRKVCGSVC